jgi:hypothetical protein
MLYLLGIAIDFFLVLILAGKKNKSEADKILLVWLFFMGLHLALYYLFSTGQVYDYPLLIGIGLPFPLVHGPFLFLYTSSLTNQVDFPRMRFLHFVPFLVTYVFLMPFLLSPEEHKVITYQNRGEGYEWLTVPLSIAVILSGIVYVGLSLLKLYRHRKNIEEQFSNTDKINLNWLRYLIIGISVIWIAVIYGSDEIIYTGVVLFIIFIGFFGIRQTTIFSHNTPIYLRADAFAERPAVRTENTPYDED